MVINITIFGPLEAVFLNFVSVKNTKNGSLDTLLLLAQKLH